MRRISSEASKRDHRVSVFATPVQFAADLWRNRRLVWQFSVRNLEVRHKGSYLGLIWSVLNPLLMVALYVVVFGFILGGRFQTHRAESRIEYALVVFLGLAIFQFLAEVIATAPFLILGNPNFVKKVVFPLEILPVASVGAAFIHMLITLCLVFVGALITGVPVTIGVLWLPLLLLPVVGMAIGVALWLSALGVFWRDISQITQFFVLMLMYASAVFFSVESIQPRIWAWMKFNPVLHAINESREVAFWGHPLNFTHAAFLYGCSFAILAVGTIVFRRLRPAFADVL